MAAAAPNFIDERFLDTQFAKWPRLVGSVVRGRLEFPAEGSMQLVDELSGGELFFGAKKASALRH